MGRRKVAIALMALTLAVAACSGGGGGGKEAVTKGVLEEEDREFPIGPTTYVVSADAPSPEGKNHLYALFNPVGLRVQPGDTVVFENHSTQAPHTVTFGTDDAEGAEPPAVLTTAGQPNPAVFAPCYLDTPLPTGAEACPAPAAAVPPAYKGVGYWNSGALTPGGVTPEGGAKIAFTLARETPVGSYHFGCLLHSEMTGLLNVVETDDERRMPEEMAKKAKRNQRVVTAAADKLVEPARTDGTSITAGWGDTLTAVNRFAPASLTVKAGQKVTWKGASPFEPHTITFESPFKSPDEPGVFRPGGVKSGSRYTDGFAHSGVIGPKPFKEESFELVLPEPGIYSYRCVLHPGMAGQVIVTP